jgi:hypothetical protein
MIPRRYAIAGLGVVLAIVLAVFLRPNNSDDGNRAAEPAANVDTDESAEPETASEGGDGEVEGGEGRGGAEEVQEEAEVTEKRLEALAEARASGDFGQKVAATTAPANRLGRVEAPKLELRRLGACGRDRPEGALDLSPHHALRGTGLRRPLPHSLHPAHNL